MKPEITARIADHARKAEKDFEDATIQCGIIGLSGTGKSSLINALLGRDVAEVGVKETTGVTSKISAYSLHGITLVDLPGVGTTHCRTDSYFSDIARLTANDAPLSFHPEGFDFFILVLANRVMEEDYKLYKLITETYQKKCFLVRSKFDIDADNNYRSKRKTDQQTHTELRDDLWSNFPKEKGNPVFVVSSAQPLRGDFETLKKAILKHLPPSKAEKFLIFSKAYSKDALKKKRRVAEHLAARVALLSACNTFNPIPGLDLATDVGLLLKLSRDLVDIYGLTPEQLDYTVRMHLENDAWGVALKQRVTQTLKSYLTKEGILLALKLLAPRLEAKHLAKLIPIAGHGLAVFIGYRLTTAYGKKVIFEIEKVAFDTMDELATLHVKT